MFLTTLLSLAIASLVVAKPMAQQPFRVSTPTELAQCAPAQFTWTATVAPYYLTIHFADDNALFTPEEDPIIVRSSNTAAWIIDYPEGTHLRVHVRDATGEVAASESMVTLKALKGHGL
ncbi:uncharacterized protein MKK02DRAFT_39776 [Dioszegia hungarica]|uniref:Uncharacterized protein n=1 Tax=Dioszegia hungarica TaxID=4972 RepID=A0AA38LX38_9TREE|nr:uncharacterized protein MKK02DRAFT_39776 [Dioszegia hungarica]KAI9639477.1 hypothetical protein MKK02DRAFT_39776 [Dioszegia hungarica]